MTIARKYRTTHIDKSQFPSLVTREYRDRRSAVRAAEQIAGFLVRVETPAGNLVTYKDNRPAEVRGY